MARQHTIAAIMNNSDLCWMSAADLAAAIARKKVSPLEVVDAVLSRIDTLKQLNAYVTLDADRARQAAKTAGAAVAAGLAPLALGTDGGGSIRKPAAWCGIFGFKASWGRIPVYPASAAWSLSHHGPMTRTVKDAALMMNACAAPDDRDQYSLPATGVDYVKALKGSLKGLRVAWSETLGIAPAVDPEVRAATAKAARSFRELGCRVESADPTWPSPYDCWRTIFLGGIGARLAPYLDRRDEIDPGLLPIVQEAQKMPPTKYVQAWVDRLAWWQHARQFFERHDLLLSPTVACPPLRIGDFYPAEIGGVEGRPRAGKAFPR